MNLFKNIKFSADRFTVVQLVQWCDRGIFWEKITRRALVRDETAFADKFGGKISWKHQLKVILGTKQYLSVKMLENLTNLVEIHFKKKLLQAF